MSKSTKELKKPIHPLGVSHGLTKLEWMTGQALNGLLANEAVFRQVDSPHQMAVVAAGAAVAAFEAIHDGKTSSKDNAPETGAQS